MECLKRSLVCRNIIVKIDAYESIIVENTKPGDIQICTSPIASKSLDNNMAIIDNNIIYIVDKARELRASLRSSRGLGNIVFHLESSVCK